MKAEKEIPNSWTISHSRKSTYVFMWCDGGKSESRVKNWHPKCQMWSRENGRNFFSQIVYISARSAHSTILPNLPTHTDTLFRTNICTSSRNSYVWMDTRPPRNSRSLWFCEFWAQRNLEIWVYAQHQQNTNRRTHFPYQRIALMLGESVFI